MKHRCVFLDRDGVINVSPPPGEYVNRPEEFHLLPNIADWIRLFKALDLLVIVITNQRGVARGLTPAQALEAIHEKMRSELARSGAAIDDIFVCPHEEATCQCRKPSPGMVHAAQSKWNIDLSCSLLIGDSSIDRELAARCGLRYIGVSHGKIDTVVHPR